MNLNLKVLEVKVFLAVLKKNTLMFGNELCYED